MKFKVNDRVKITNIRDEDVIYDIDPDYLIGKIGTVVSVDHSPYSSEDADNIIDCPYELVFDDYKAEHSGNAFWEEDELELICLEEIPLYPFDLPNDKNISDAFKYLKSKGVTPETYEKLWNL